MRIPTRSVLAASLLCYGCNTPAESPQSEDTGAEPGTDAYVEARGVQRCAAPWDGEGSRFTAAGSDVWPVDANDDAAAPGIAVGDVDGDGGLDVFVPRAGAQDHLLLFRDGAWVDASDRLPQDDTSVSLGGSVADADGDGDLDVYVLRVGAPDVLLVNDGEGRFSEVEVGGSTDEARWNASWGDADGDGDLDVFIGTQTLTGGTFGDLPAAFSAAAEGDGPEHLPDPDDNHLWMAQADGSWTDATDMLPATAREAYTFVAPWVDVDRDGLSDLYVVNDFGPMTSPNRPVMVDPDAGLFDATGSYGLDVRMYGMGAGINDLNHDGRPDMVLSSIDAMALLLSDTTGRWSLYTLAANLITPTYPDDAGLGRFVWGVAAQDLDNDGDHDVLAGAGRLLDHDGNVSEPHEVDRFLAWTMDDGQFAEVGNDLGLGAQGRWRGLIVQDLNGDGFVDVLRAGWHRAPELLLNRCTDHAWLTVEVRDPAGPNTFGVGARVTALTSTRTFTNWVMAGGEAPASGGAPRVHFGLGALDDVNAIEVEWPDGTRLQHFGLESRQHVVVTKPVESVVMTGN